MGPRDTRQWSVVVGHALGQLDQIDSSPVSSATAHLILPGLYLVCRWVHQQP